MKVTSEVKELLDSLSMMVRIVRNLLARGKQYGDAGDRRFELDGDHVDKARKILLKYGIKA